MIENLLFENIQNIISSKSYCEDINYKNFKIGSYFSIIIHIYLSIYIYIYIYNTHTHTHIYKIHISIYRIYKSYTSYNRSIIK